MSNTLTPRTYAEENVVDIIRTEMLKIQEYLEEEDEGDL